MKKILVIHNRYQITGGEDIAVENEIKFLQKQYNVKVLYFENTINSFFSRCSILYSITTIKVIKK